MNTKLVLVALFLVGCGGVGEIGPGDPAPPGASLIGEPDSGTWTSNAPAVADGGQDARPTPVVVGTPAQVTTPTPAGVPTRR